MPLLNKNKKEEIKKAIDSGDTNIIKAVKKQPLVGPLQMAAIPVSGPQEALMIAAMAGDLQEMKLAIASGADLNVWDQDGLTAMMWACIMGHMQAAKHLIDAGADLNTRDKGGMTALMHAAIAGMKDIAKLLIDSGADVFAEDKRRATALTHAVGYPEIASMNSQYDNGPVP